MLTLRCSLGNCSEKTEVRRIVSNAAEMKSVGLTFPSRYRRMSLATTRHGCLTWCSWIAMAASVRPYHASRDVSTCVPTVHGRPALTCRANFSQFVVRHVRYLFQYLLHAAWALFLAVNVFFNYFHCAFTHPGKPASFLPSAGVSDSEDEDTCDEEDGSNR